MKRKLNLVWRLRQIEKDRFYRAKLSTFNGEYGYVEERTRRWVVKASSVYLFGQTPVCKEVSCSNVTARRNTFNANESKRHNIFLLLQFKD